MTIATKYAVLKGVPYAKAYGVFGRKYPNVGYGTMFKRWIDSYCERGYNSYGNGSAMRVSFIGEHFDTLKKVEDEAQKSALCTHNHPEGVKGAQVIAGCGYLAKNGASKKEIKSYVQKKFGYSLNKRLSFYRVFSRFDMSCQKSIALGASMLWRAIPGRDISAMCSAFGAIPTPSALSPAALRTLIFMVLASTKTPCKAVFD